VSDFDFVIVVRDDVDSAGDGKRVVEGTRGTRVPEDFLSGLSSDSGETLREVDGLDALSSENRELGNTLERRRAQASGSWVLNLGSGPGF
jgi:hypothetical protein